MIHKWSIRFLWLFIGCLLLLGGYQQTASSPAIIPQIGNGDTFGNPELSWGSTSQSDIQQYLGLSGDSWSVDPLGSACYTEDNAVRFTDMHADHTVLSYLFEDAECTRLMKYILNFRYENEADYTRDLEMIRDYVADTYPDSEPDEEDPLRLLIDAVAPDGSCLIIDAWTEPNGSYAIMIQVLSRTS